MATIQVKKRHILGVFYERNGEYAMTKQEAVLISAYTGYLLVPDFSDVAEYCQKVLGRPIYTHEYADPDLQRELQDKLRPRIMDLIRSLSDGRTPEIKDGDDRPAITLCRDCVYWEHRSSDLRPNSPAATE